MAETDKIRNAVKMCMDNKSIRNKFNGNWCLGDCKSRKRRGKSVFLDFAVSNSLKKVDEIAAVHTWLMTVHTVTHMIWL